MARSSIVVVCCLVLLVPGCLAGSSASDGGTEPTTTVEECGPQENGETIPCPVESHPPDLKVFSSVSHTHDISVRVVRDDSTTVLSENVTDVEARDGYSTVLEDVATEPGTYTIEAAIGNATERYEWEVGDEVEHGGPVMGVYVEDADEIAIERVGWE